jgi:hypothetical protein
MAQLSIPSIPQVGQSMKKMNVKRIGISMRKVKQEKTRVEVAKKEIKEDVIREGGLMGGKDHGHLRKSNN